MPIIFLVIMLNVSPSYAEVFVCQGESKTTIFSDTPCVDKSRSNKYASRDEKGFLNKWAKKYNDKNTICKGMICKCKNETLVYSKDTLEQFDESSSELVVLDKAIKKKKIKNDTIDHFKCKWNMHSQVVEITYPDLMKKKNIY